MLRITPCLAGLVAVVPLIAQTPDAGGTEAPAPSVTNINLAPNAASAANLLMLSREAFNPNSDSLDLEDGTFTWKGRVFTLGQDRVFRSRFERYLSMPENPVEAEDYKRILDAIFAELATSNGMTGVTVDSPAWGMLFQAADYAEWDGGHSLIVANQVHNAMRVRDENRVARFDSAELERVKRVQQEIVTNRNRILSQLNQRRQAMIDGNETTSFEYDGLGVESEAQFRAADLAETEARIAALQTQSAASGVQAKLQFQSQILSFFLQRRFQHALMASAFYRQTFKGSQQALEVGTTELQRFLPDSDLTFTIDTLDFMSREAINDVQQGMKAVDAAYERGHRLQALQRLQETFILGEYLPAVYLYPEEKRQTLFSLLRLLKEAQDLVEVRDLGAAEETVEEIMAVTGDFPERKILSAITSAKSMSDFAIFAAAQYRNTGDIDAARGELERAIEVWPTNPRIRDFQQETSILSSRGTQGQMLFDDLLEREDWRGIYDRRVELGMALAEDPVRGDQLKEIIERLMRVDGLLTQAEEMQYQEEGYAAWELLSRAAELAPDDGPVNRLRGDLAPRVADFVQALDRADRAEAAGRYSIALTAYLQARQVFPLSRLCREGITRVSERLMDQFDEPPPPEQEAPEGQEENRTG